MYRFKERYLEALSQQRGAVDLQPTVMVTPTKKRGRLLILGDLNVQVQSYIRALCAAGTPISTQIIQATAEGIVNIVILKSSHRERRTRSSLTWMGPLTTPQDRTTQKIKQLSEADSLQKKSTFLRKIASLAHAHNIPPDVTFNWDQTGMHLLELHHGTAWGK